MKNESLGAAARCPFFRRMQHGTGRICCEGLTDESGIILYYAKREELQIQFESFCCGRYGNCEIFRAIIEAKYQD